MPQVIPIEILNISDVTSLAPKKEGIETNKNEIKKVKQQLKKFKYIQLATYIVIYLGITFGGLDEIYRSFY